MAPVNAGIKRRHFLRVLGCAAVALAAAPLAPMAPTSLGAYQGVVPVLPAAVVPARLVFHKEAFAWVVEDFKVGDTVRTRFDVGTRFDILVGWKNQGDFRARVLP